MTDDSAVPIVVEILPEGRVDTTFVADLALGDSVYISGDRQVTKIDTTEANLKKYLGTVEKPVVFGQDLEVPIKSKFSRIVKRTAGVNLTAGTPYKFSGATAGAVIAFVEGTDAQSLLVGIVLVGALATAQIEGLEE